MSPHHFRKTTCKISRRHSGTLPRMGTIVLGTGVPIYMFDTPDRTGRSGGVKGKNYKQQGIKMKFRTWAVLIIGVVLAVNGHSQSFLTNGLVAYYPFNGNVNDASGNGNNGTVFGATLTTDRFGNPNSAYYFNGSTDYITAPLTSTVFNGDFTASVWFNAYDSVNSATLLHEQQQAFDEGISGNILNTFADPGYYDPEGRDWYLLDNSPIPTNSYCQVVVTKSGTNTTMYLNSLVVATSPVGTNALLAGSFLTIGRADVSVYPQSAFHGVIDDIRIYNVALSSNQVSQLYASEAAPILDIGKAVYLVSSNLWVGSNYQVQISTTANGTYTNYGAPFTATNAVWQSVNYWSVEDWNQLFFRLKTP